MMWSEFTGDPTTPVSLDALLHTFLRSANDIERPSREIKLDNKSFSCSPISISSRILFIIGQQNTMVTSSLSSEIKQQQTENRNHQTVQNQRPASIFVLRNTTLSLSTLAFDLRMLKDEQDHFGRPANIQNSVSCGILSSSHVSVDNVSFFLSSGASPFVVSSTELTDNSASTLILSRCLFFAELGVMGAFANILEDAPFASSVSVSIHSLSLSSLAVSNPSGLAFHLSPSMSQNPSTFQIKSLISACSFRNMTSCQFSSSMKPKLQGIRIIDSTMENVENSLYGTITPKICQHKEFSCTNCSIVECTNTENGGSTKEIEEDRIFTSSTQQIKIDSAFSHYSFTRCTFTATNTTTSFSLISLSPLEGNMRFSLCTFKVEIGSTHNTLIDCTAKRDLNLDCVIDSCTFTFWRESAVSTASNQLVLSSFLHIFLVSSTFSPPPPDPDSDTPRISSARTVHLQQSVTFLFTSNCHFRRQTSTANGGVFYLPNAIPRLTDSLFEDCQSEGNGGSIFTLACHHILARCVFRRSKATLGGALKLDSLRSILLIDCHFEGNEAVGTYANDPDTRAHYRGNDICVLASSLSAFTSTTVDCSSSTPSPKLGYYSSATTNGNMTTEDTLLPSPSVVTPPTNEFFVEDGTSGDCSGDSPCGSLGTALSQTGTGTNLINIGSGSFEVPATSISSNVEVFGDGFLTNTSTFTTVVSSGLAVSGSGNLTLVSLSLKPKDATSQLITMESSKETRLSTVRIECISSHEVSLLSVSSGSSILFACWFNSIEMERDAVISISGSAAVSFQRCWFMLIKRKEGNGGSCLDWSSSKVLRFGQCDFAHCSSSGRAGCLDLVATETTSSVSFSSVIFTSNTANTTLPNHGNDISHSRFTSANINTASSCRSTSALPHALVDLTSKQSFDCPSRYFSPGGIDHPLAIRFDQAVPQSWFKGFQNEIDALMESTTQVSIRSDYTFILDPFEIVRKNILIFSCPLTIPTCERTLVRVGCGASVHLATNTISVTQSFAEVPIVVEGDADLLLMSYTKLYLSSHQLYPFVQCRGGELQIITMTVQPATFISFGESSFIDCESCTASIATSSFSNLQTKGDGAVLHAVNTTVTCSDSSFAKCTARNGGVLFVELDGSKYVIVTHSKTSSFSTTFENCCAVGEGDRSSPEGKGGALFVKGRSTSSTPIRFNSSDTDHARFEQNSALLGQDLFVGSLLLSSVETSKLSEFGGGSLSANDHVVIEGRPETDKSVIGLLIPTPSISVNGSVKEVMTGMSGVDSIDCKWTSSFCATLEYGIRFLKTKYPNGDLFPQSMKFVWNMSYFEKDVVVSDQDVVVSGTTGTKVEAGGTLRTIVEVNKTITSPFLFTINDSALFTISELDILTSVSVGLFILEESGGRLGLSKVGIVCSLGNPHTQPLIKSEGRPVVIESSTFNTSSSLLGSFSHPIIQLLTPSTPSSASITLSSVSFTSLQTTSSALVEIDTDGVISVLGTTFSSCSCSSGIKGEHVFVRTSNPEASITRILWKDSFSITTPPNAFYVEDRGRQSSDEWFSLPLLLFLIDPTGPVLVDASAHSSTHTNCGSSSLACSSLESAFLSATTHTLSEISLNISSSVTAQFVVASNLAIHSATSSPIAVDLKTAAQFVVSAPSSTLSLTNLHFSIDSTCSASPLFLVSSGKLVLSSCRIGGDSVTELPSTLTTLVKVSGEGTLDIVDSTFKQLHFTHPSEGTTIHLSLDSAFTTSTASIFDDITSKGTGSHIFAESTNLATLSQSTSFTLLKQSMPLLPNTIFSLDEKMKIVGKVGDGDAESLLFFWHPHTETEATLSVSEEGEDHPNCGLPQLPCRTLEKGLTLVKKTGTEMIVSSAGVIKSSLSTSHQTQTLKSKKEKETISIEQTGSLTVLTDHFLILSNLDFTLETGQRTVSALKTASGSLTINSCSFGSSLSDTTIDSSLIEVSGSLVLTSTVFTRINSSTDSLVRIELSGSHSVSFESTSLVSYSAPATPLISLTLSSTTDQTDWDFDLSGLSFSLASSNSDPSGVQIFVSGPSFATQIKPSRFPSVGSLTDPKAFWGNDTSTEVSSSLLVYLIAAGREICVDGENGKDIAHCGHFGVSCLTIRKGILRANGEDGSKEIRIVDSTALDGLISPNALTISLVGDSPIQAVTILENGGFSVVDGSLSLSTLSFSTSVSSFSKSLISVSLAGSLSINSCSFTSFSSQSSASILTATIAAQQSVTITDTTFSNCNTKGSARSGVLDVTMAVGSEFAITHSGNPFTSCSSPFAVANHILISHPSLSKEVIEASFLFTWDQTSRTSKNLMGKEGDHQIPIPLALFFLQLPQHVFIDSEWCDVSVCGFEEYPCASLSTLHSKISEISDPIISITSSLTHSDELTLTAKMSLVGGNNELRITEQSLSPTECGLFTTTADVSFEALFVTVPSTFKHTSLMDCQSGSLSVTNSSFSQESSTPIPTVLIEVHSDASLSISKSFFTSITSSHPKASVISAVLSESGSLHLDNNTFSSCSCSGKAHSIFVSLDNSSEVHVDTFDYSLTSLVFSSVSPNSESALSIDVLVVGHHLDRTVTLDRWEGSFSREKGESVWGDDKTTGMNTSLLPYLVSISGEVEVDWKGFQFEKCGHFFLFCSSFELGVARMEEADLNRIKIVEKIEVTSTIEMKGENAVVGASIESILCFGQDGSFENSPNDSINSSLSFASLVIAVDPLDRTTPLFVSTCGSLSFSSCSFVGSGSTTISFSLISISQSELILSEVIANSITLDSLPLILSKGSVSISKSNFTSINRVAGLGCVLDAQSDDEVKVVDSSFELCRSGNTQTWILLHGANEKTLKVENWEGTLDRFSARASVLLDSSYDPDSISSSSTEQSEPYSLLYEFYPRVSGEIVVSVGEVNEDHRLCGSWELPCLTVDKSVLMTGVRKVEIFGLSEMKSLMTMDGDLLWIVGHKKKGILKMIGPSQIVNNVFDDPDTLLLSFVTVDVSDTTLSSSDTLILNENGEVSIDSSTFKSSNVISFSLIRLTGGEVSVTNLTLSDVTFSSIVFDLSSSNLCSFTDVLVSETRLSSFLKVSDTDRLVLKSFSFDGSPPNMSSEVSERNEGDDDEEGKDVCEWTDSLIRVVNTTSIFENVKVSHVGSGGIWMDGGSMKVEASTFHDNFVTNSSFPSVRRNIHCSNGVLNIESLSGGDGSKDLPSAWISVGEECQFSSLIVDVRSPHFIPSLNRSESTISRNSKTKTFTAELVGSLLIPCGLWVEVYEWNEKTKAETGKKVEIDLSTTSFEKWNETRLTLKLNEDPLKERLEMEQEWRLRVMSGSGIVGDDWVRLKMSVVAERKALAVESLKWAIPVAAGIIAAMVVILIVIVCCRRRKNQSVKKEVKKEELQEEEFIEKMEFGDEPTMGRHVIESTAEAMKDKTLTKQGPEQPTETQPEPQPLPSASNGQVHIEVIEVMDCVNFGSHYVSRQNSLYHRLHVQKSPLENKRREERRLATALLRIKNTTPLADVLLHLSSHWVKINKDGELCLLMEDGIRPPNGEQSKTDQTMNCDADGEKRDGQRWSAPEQFVEKGEMQQQIDTSQVSVFRLGLVLWEIETGQIPFGETDAVNACRQLKAGIVPAMDGVPNVSMRDLITRCLCVNADDRPSLEAVASTLCELEEEAILCNDGLIS
ncbi:hypothetical protein BLNAU_8690 [Blattamonas nauphoetae]|uniref:Protein kinase domain-containing protein n=1 Tax=Blattamonas nauphoetae TaxID=2049346 RepID=A0ABQ9XY04_9EUKA|nr:hypothetical protein BLNAU_8690 [Blattamonas nauphoetae]